MAKALVKENWIYILLKTLMEICNNNARMEMENRIKKFIHILRNESNEKVDENLKFIIERNLSRINNSKINFDYNIAKTGNSNNINNDDLNRLVETLLDNAIKACKQIKDEKLRWIKFNIYEEDRFLYIDVINSNNHPNTKSVNDEKRGRGFECLKMFLKKYDGDLFSYGHYIDKFSVEIQIPIRKESVEK